MAKWEKESFTVKSVQVYTNDAGSVVLWVGTKSAENLTPEEARLLIKAIEKHAKYAENIRRNKG